MKKDAPAGIATIPTIACVLMVLAIFALGFVVQCSKAKAGAMIPCARPNCCGCCDKIDRCCCWRSEEECKCPKPNDPSLGETR